MSMDAAASERAHVALERLLAAHEACFDVEHDYSFAGRDFAGYAELHSSASQYVLVKRAKLWETTSHEYLSSSSCLFGYRNVR